MMQHIELSNLSCTLNESHANVLTWDGRLDNGEDLLLELGMPTRGRPGDETVVRAVYERDGINGLRRVIGDWSIVIHDVSRGALVLASDFMGVRPLYYRADSREIRWSTDLESLQQATTAESIDERYAGAFMLLGGCSDRTPYVGIAAVPPGHVVQITTTGTSVRSLWSLPTGDTIRYRNESDYDDHLRRLFREAVAVRLTDAVALCELSGGLDSSSVVCMAADLVRCGCVRTRRLVTVSYEFRGSLDTPYIRDVEAFCGIDGVHLSTHENPLATHGQVGGAAPEGWAPVHAAMAAVARQVDARTVLTGQGGDLVMGNFPDDSLQIAGRFRRGEVRLAAGEALAWSRVLRIPVAGILWRGLRAALPPRLATVGAYLSDGPVMRNSETSLAPGFLRRIDVGSAGECASTQWLHAPPERRKHFHAVAFMQTLRALRRHEAAGGLDHTHPFAHRPLLEFLMRLPADVLCGPGTPRRLMRRALAGLWPSSLRARRSKSLFSAPWLEALKPMARTLKTTEPWQVVERGWIDRASLHARLDRLERGLDCNEPQLRQIILLECWLRVRARRHHLEGLPQIA